MFYSSVLVSFNFFSSSSFCYFQPLLLLQSGEQVSVVGASVVSCIRIFIWISIRKSFTTAAVTKDKILSIDLEASSFDGITYPTSRDQIVSTIMKTECLILSFFNCDMFCFNIYYNAAGNLDMSEIEPKFFF
jgi:hypothetical protein